MCIFSFFRKIKIERNTKLKLIVYILGITYYKMSLTEAPKLLFIKQKRKESRAVEGGRIIFRHTIGVGRLLANSSSGYVARQYTVLLISSLNR